MDTEINQALSETQEDDSQLPEQLSEQNLEEQGNNEPQPSIEELLAERDRLRKHNQTLLEEKRAKQEQARQAQLERERLEQEQLRKEGNLEALEKAWQEKLETYEEQVKQLKQEREKDLLERESQKAASQLTSNSRDQQLLQRFILDRLAVSNGEVRALDKNGQPINKVTELVNEFRTCGLYDSLIVGTRASGTGGTGGVVTSQSPSDMSEAERIELLKTDPERFKQLFQTK